MDLLKAVSALDPLTAALDAGLGVLPLGDDTKGLLKGVAKVAAAMTTGNVVMGASGVADFAGGIGAWSASREPEYLPPEDPALAASGYAVDGRQLEDALQVLRDQFAALETAGAFLKLRDGVLTREDLLAAANDPDVPARLRQCAAFFLAHPEEMEKLGGPRGRVQLSDVEVALLRLPRSHGPAPARPPPSEPAPAPAPRPAPPSEPSTRGERAPPKAKPTSDLRKILSDPRLSLEQKLELVTQQLLRGLDEEILSTMDELATAQDSLAAAKDKPGKAKNAKATELQRGVELIQLRLQKLIERRTQMFQLMSTLSDKFHEMAKVALHNLARA
jgi:hypothetical protein